MTKTTKPSVKKRATVAKTTMAVTPRKDSGEATAKKNDDVDTTEVEDVEMTSVATADDAVIDEGKTGDEAQEDLAEDDEDGDDEEDGKLSAQEAALMLRTKKQMSYAAKAASTTKAPLKQATIPGLNNKINKITVLELTAQHKSNESVIQCARRTLKATVLCLQQAFKGQAGVLPIDQSESKQPGRLLTNVALIPDKITAHVFSYVGGQVMFADVQLLLKKKKSKTSEIKFALRVASTTAFTGTYVKWRAFLVEMASHEIEVDEKEFKSCTSVVSRMILFGFYKFPLPEVNAWFNACVSEAVDIYFVRTKLISDARPDIGTHVTCGWPAGNYNRTKTTHRESKMVWKIECEAQDVEWLDRVDKDLKVVMRRHARHASIYPIPERFQTLSPEDLETYQSQLHNSMTYHESVSYHTLPGFRPNKLDLSVKILKGGDPNDSVTSNARRLLMEMSLPTEEEGEPKPVILGLMNSHNGVEAAFPAKRKYLNAVLQMAASPAGYIMYRLIWDFNATEANVDSFLRKVFSTQARAQAIRCAMWCDETKNVLLTLEEAARNGVSEEEQAIMNLDWIQQHDENETKRAGIRNDDGKDFDFLDTSSMTNSEYRKYEHGEGDGYSVDSNISTMTMSEVRAQIEEEYRKTAMNMHEKETAPPSEDDVGQGV